MIEQTSQGDEKEAAMGIDQDRTCAHVEYRCCTTDHGEGLGFDSDGESNLGGRDMTI